jgi:cephalosporin-C deacetylase-like acetyl esterase
MLMGRIAGWPKIVPVVDGNPDMSVLEAYRYVDCMNFATRTKAAGAYFTVGFIDNVCPPTSVYAAYNQLSIPKEIYNDIPSGHAHSQAARDGMTKAVLKHVGK